MAANADVSDRCLKKHGRWKSDSSKNGYRVESTEKRLKISKKMPKTGIRRRIGYRDKCRARKRVRKNKDSDAHTIEEHEHNGIDSDAHTIEEHEHIVIYATSTDTRFWPVPELIELGDKSNVQSPAYRNENGETNENIEHYVVLDKVYQYDPNNSLDEFVTTKREEHYSTLKRSCQKLLENPLYAPIEFMRTARIIRFVSVYDSDNPGVKLICTIRKNYSAEVFVHGKRLSDQHDLWRTEPGKFVTIQRIERLLKVLLHYDVCIGNPDEGLQKLCSGKMGYVETGYGAYRGDCVYQSTIRTISCMLLTDRWKPRCKNCIIYRKTIKKQESREKHKSPASSKNWLTSRKGNSRLTDSEKFEKIKQLKNYSSDLESQVAALKKKVKKSIRTDGILISENNRTKDMVNLMTSCENIVD